MSQTMQPAIVKPVVSQPVIISSKAFNNVLYYTGFVNSELFALNGETYEPFTLCFSSVGGPTLKDGTVEVEYVFSVFEQPIDGVQSVDFSEVLPWDRSEQKKRKLTKVVQLEDQMPMSPPEEDGNERELRRQRRAGRRATRKAKHSG